MLKAIQIPYDNNFDVRCAHASEAGFDGIAVNLSTATDFTDSEWEGLGNTINNILQRHELRCFQTHLPMHDMMLSAELRDERAERAISYAVKTSGEIGALWCAYHPRTAFNYGCSSSVAEKLNHEEISQYVELAEKYGTGIAVENIPIFHEITPVIPFYSSDYYDLCELTDRFNSDKIGICWDTGHANLMSFNQAEAIEYIGKRIKCTHIHNNFKLSDDHLNPDNGNIDWKSVMAAFDNIDYRGPFTLETNCRYSDNELWKSFARHNLECLSYLERLNR